MHSTFDVDPERVVLGGTYKFSCMSSGCAKGEIKGSRVGKGGCHALEKDGQTIFLHSWACWAAFGELMPTHAEHLLHSMRAIGGDSNNQGGSGPRVNAEARLEAIAKQQACGQRYKIESSPGKLADPPTGSIFPRRSIPSCGTHPLEFS